MVTIDCLQCLFPFDLHKLVVLIHKVRRLISDSRLIVTVRRRQDSRVEKLEEVSTIDIAFNLTKKEASMLIHVRLQSKHREAACMIKRLAFAVYINPGNVVSILRAVRPRITSLKVE